MSRKTRSTLKVIAVILIVLWALMAQSLIIIPILVPYMFWMVIVSFVLLFLAAR